MVERGSSIPSGINHVGISRPFVRAETTDHGPLLHIQARALSEIRPTQSHDYVCPMHDRSRRAIVSSLRTDGTSGVSFGPAAFRWPRSRNVFRVCGSASVIGQLLQTLQRRGQGTPIPAIFRVFVILNP